LPDTCTGNEVVAVEFDGTVPTAVDTADVVDIGALVVEALESLVEAAEVVELVVCVVAELVVVAEGLVDWVLRVMVDAAGGGMTLKLTVAPQSEREDPLGQQPPSVQ